MQSRLQSLSSSTTTKLTISKQGGADAIPTTIDQLISAAANFPKEVNQRTGSPVPYYATTLDYGAVINFPSGHETPDFSSQKAALNSLAKDRDYASLLKNDWTFVRSNIGQFSGITAAQADAKNTQLAGIIGDIERKAFGILSKPFDTLPDTKTQFGPDLVAPTSAIVPVSLAVLVHLEGIGDVTFSSGQWAGTKGQSRRLEGFALTISPAVPGLSLEYMAHLEGTGDTGWVAEKSFCGTRGQSRRLEGLAIRLTGVRASEYNVVYSAHLENIGDTGPYSNGDFCGTRGQSR